MMTQITFCVIVFLVGIEAADLTSLLEQFEETQGKSLAQLFFFSS